jgi:manganese oxidase
MEMPLPDNTLPMMTGQGPFGPLEMGGMFTVLKVRDGLAADDYRDPGPYQHPPGTVAYEFNGTLAEPARAAPSTSPAPAASKSATSAPTSHPAPGTAPAPAAAAGQGGHGGHH